ncbi:NAD(P)H-dependent oxidoreductase [Mycobacterium sp. Y57]|uniref:flavodoxin n=1 Tax=Mycolicibacterium xanthum TaxID=2796469 RepID=UPI001C847E70|nr:flavodoxin [Mycolicibacterium xanthum]MBX7435207.1 NAD(P)H-dependent oxidoreductase [Mycolicibacterium xanthum]
MFTRRTLLAACCAAGSAIALGGCTGAARSPGANESPTTQGHNVSSPDGVLLAYFSRPGENYFNGGRIDLDVGNTEVLAKLIAATVPVTTYRIEAADPYPHSYDETVARNVDEQQRNARPAIANPLPELTGYHTVLLGSPIWNVRPPMIMSTFIDGVDLAGKTVHPFVTYAVSGLGSTVADYTTLAPRATLGQALAIRGEEAGNARDRVRAWLEQISLTA